jgi:DNA replication protein DnaC
MRPELAALVQRARDAYTRNGVAAALESDLQQGYDYEAERIAAAVLRLPTKWQTEYGDGHWEVGTGIYFHGPIGTSKTYEAAGIAHAAITRGTIVEWVAMSAWLFQMRESFGGGGRAASIERLTRAGLLVLDDMGAGDSGDKAWKQDAVYVLVSEAYDANVPMVVTSNLTFAELSTQLGARVTDRLVERCRDVALTGRSRRLDAAIARKKEAGE